MDDPEAPRSPAKDESQNVVTSGSILAPPVSVKHDTDTPESVAAKRRLANNVGAPGSNPRKGTNQSLGWLTLPAAAIIFVGSSLAFIGDSVRETSFVFARNLWQFRSKRREERKKTLTEALRSKTLQRFILLLVILDLVIVAVSVQFPGVALLAFLNAFADRILLIIFLFEAVAQMYVVSPIEYIRQPWHVVDGLFILVSLMLELHEVTVHEDDLHPASPFVGLIVRVWRLVRIVHAFTIALELEYQEAKNAEHLEERLREALQRVSILESELYHEKHGRAVLERELARLNRVKRSYDALGVRVPL